MVSELVKCCSRRMFRFEAVTEVMVSSGITQYGLSNSKIDPCGVCSLRVMANSVLCGKWIHG